MLEYSFAARDNLREGLQLCSRLAKLLNNQVKAKPRQNAPKSKCLHVLIILQIDDKT